MPNETTVDVNIGGSPARALIAAERAIADEGRAQYEAFLADPVRREAQRLADIAALDEAFGDE